MEWSSRVGKSTWRNQTHKKSGNHGIKSPLRVSVITNQCVNCGSTFADRPTAQNHVVNTWTTGTCRTECSHITWALEEITFPISCNLCAQEFGNLQTYYTHARMTHLPFPAPTVRESKTQQARQPRRRRQHSGNGQERGPMLRQKGRKQRRRGAAKAAPTNRQQSQTRRRFPRIDGSGSQAVQGRIQAQAEEPQQVDTQGNLKNAPDDAQHADAGAARTYPLDVMRRGEILQAGKNVKHRVTGKTAPRTRSTQSSRDRAQARTSATQSHGTRSTSVPGRSSEDVKIMVRTFLAEEGVQASSKAWHNAMQREHIQRMAIAHQSSTQRTLG